MAASNRLAEGLGLGTSVCLLSPEHFPIVLAVAPCSEAIKDSAGHVDLTVKRIRSTALQAQILQLRSNLYCLSTCMRVVGVRRHG